MADISVTKTVAPCYPGSKDGTEILPRLAAVAITAGQAVFVNSTGTVDLADANNAGSEQFRGIALQTVGAGQAVGVCQRGAIEGFDLSGLAYDAIVFLSDNAGNLATAASGTKTVKCGRVVPLTSKDGSGAVNKVLWVASDLTNNW